MKLTRFTYIVLLVLIALSSFHMMGADKADHSDYTILQPEPQHPRVVQLVTELLKRNHYKNVPIDDSLSSQVFNNYLNYLDYNKSYFLKSDISEFEKHRYDFDDYLQQGNLALVYTIFNRFQQRMDERLEYVFKRLDKPFDFTKDENFEPYRDSLDWFVNKEQLDEFWRKKLKNEALSLKIAGKKDAKVKELLTKRYTNLKTRLSQNQSEDVIQLFLNAYAQVYDPHTDYFSPKASDDFRINMSLSLEGIGARLSTENEYTKVMEIIPGGPADLSGLLKPNDLIIGVGQENEELTDVIGWRIDDVVQLIRGPKGTKVSLQILHSPDEQISDAETITITRDKVKLEESAAKSDTLHINIDHRNFLVGVIHVPKFYHDYEAQMKGDPDFKSTTKDVRRILNDFQKKNVDGVIIDLRENGGGFLNEAIDLTGLFIPTGPVVQVKDSRGLIKVDNDDDPQEVYSGPLAVLVDQFSASASEIFAAAIQDYKRGIIIGNQTYGKGTVQNALDLNRYMPNSRHKLGQLKLTMAKFYRINGGSTQHVGVIPNIQLPSRFKHDEVGESSQKNALLWDQINAVKYHTFNTHLDSYLPTLKTNHSLRMEHNLAFAEYNEDVEKYRNHKDRKVFSLNENKRRAERKANKKDDNNDDDEDTPNKKKKDKEDIMLKESGNILGDYIYLSEKMNN